MPQKVNKRIPRMSNKDAIKNQLGCSLNDLTTQVNL